MNNDYPYPWKAFFYDGTTISQFDADGNQHFFAEILSKGPLLDYIEIKGLRYPLVINYPRDTTPVIFCRNVITKEGDYEERERHWFFGYKYNNSDKASFVVIHDPSKVVSIEFQDFNIRS